MSINSLSDWSALELKAQTHELKQVETVKPPTPTVAQQLVWVTTRAAELQARLHRKDGAISSAIMWLSLGEPQRAQEALNKGLLDL